MNHGIGVQSNGAATEILNSTIRLNGQVGISASGGKNSFVRGTEIGENGWAGYKPATFTGGIAAANKATMKVTGAKILDNSAAGKLGVRRARAPVLRSLQAPCGATGSCLSAFWARCSIPRVRS